MAPVQTILDPDQTSLGPGFLPAQFRVSVKIPTHLDEELAELFVAIECGEGRCLVRIRGLILHGKSKAPSQV